MKGKFDVIFWGEVDFFNSSPVYCLRLYSVFYHCAQFCQLRTLVIGMKSRYIYNVRQDLSFRFCKFCYLFNINECLGLLKLADTVLILINPSPSNVKAHFRSLPRPKLYLGLNAQPEIIILKVIYYVI